MFAVFTLKVTVNKVDVVGHALQEFQHTVDNVVSPLIVRKRFVYPPEVFVQEDPEVKFFDRSNRLQ